MRRKSRKDINHEDVADALRRLGCGVWDLSREGRGIPDLLVKILDTWRLVEVKNPQSQYGRKGLNKNQQQFNAQAGGGVDIVRTAGEAVAFVERVRAEIRAKVHAAS